MSNARDCTPPVDLILTACAKKRKSDLVKHELYYDPEDKDQGTYHVSMRALQSFAQVEGFLWWCQDIKEIISGRNIKAAAGKFQLTRSMSKGNLKRDFMAYKKRLEKIDDGAYEAAMLELSNKVFNEDSIPKQVKYIRTVKKPSDMKFSEYVARERQLIDWLTYMKVKKDQTIPKIDDDELKVITHDGSPEVWKDHLAKSNTNIASLSLTSLQAYFMKIEKKEARARKQGKPNKKKTKFNDENKSNEGRFYCKLHGHDKGHDTKDCYTLKKQREERKERDLENSGLKEKYRKYNKKSHLSVVSMLCPRPKRLGSKNVQIRSALRKRRGSTMTHLSLVTMSNPKLQVPKRRAQVAVVLRASK